MPDPAILTLERKALNIGEYRDRHAEESDYERLVTQPSLVYEPDGKEPKIVYLTLEEECDELVEALNTIDYDKTYRVKGMMTLSRTIGYSPRVTIRRDFCTTSSTATTHPAEHVLITSYAAKVAKYYQEFAPALYAEHEQMTQKVLSDWRIEESVFTSGIVNKNNPLPYHFDTGNFKNVWSNMLVFKHNVRGGYLAVPEYGLGFELRHNSLLMFDGQNILHGVTPIYQLTEDAYRYSIVYYSLQQMWKCLPPKEEMLRIRKIRSEREERPRGKTNETQDHE